MRETKLCLHCGKEFERPATCGMPEWTTRRKFCSYACKAASQKGIPSWNKGLSCPRPKSFIPCRICGKPTKYPGTESHPHYHSLNCGRQSCVDASRLLKNRRIRKSMLRAIDEGRHSPPEGGWQRIPLISKEEQLLSPWLESLGWLPQYKFLTGVHTNKLPRMFRLDFALPDHQLYIEVDGRSHRLRKDRDARRDSMMSERGWTGLRISAKDVRTDVEGIKRRIQEWLSTMSTDNAIKECP